MSWQAVSGLDNAHAWKAAVTAFWFQISWGETDLIGCIIQAS